MADARDIILQQRTRLETREPVHVKIPCIIVTRDSLLAPPNRPNYSFVKELYRPESQRVVLNETTLKTEGTLVEVEIDPNKNSGGRVIGIYSGTLTPTESEILSRGNVGEHAPNHQYPTEAAPGPDSVLVYQPAVQPLKTTGDGSTLVVDLQPLIYTVEGVRKVFVGITVDLTSYVPSTSGRAVRVLVYLDITTNLAAVLSGTEVIDSVAIPVPYPQIPQDAIPSAYVKLTNGQTAVTTATHVDDARAMFSSNGSYGFPLTPTEEGQIIIVQDGDFALGVPMVDIYGDIMTNADGTILTG